MTAYFFFCLLINLIIKVINKIGEIKYLVKIKKLACDELIC